MIRVQEHNFSVTDEYQKLLQAGKSGAVVTFVGCVRDFSPKTGEFFLQHYPGMTETVLANIETRARGQWPIIHATMIHRVGKLNPGDQIVFVGVSTAHRRDAFAACEYIIDILKTEAPFWKKEGEQWLDAKESDTQAAERWLKNSR